MGNGTLKTVSELELVLVKTDHTGKVAVDSAIPDGTKIVSITTDAGELKDVWLEPPPGSDPSLLPRPGTKEFNEATKFVGTSKFYSQPVSQGDQVSAPLLFPIGIPAENVSRGGRAPYLVGRVPCGDGKCLLVRFDETMETEGHLAHDLKIVGTAKGYILLDEQSLDVKESLVWLYSDMRSKAKNMVSNMIVQITAASE